jgi:hypothetical protein
MWYDNPDNNQLLTLGRYEARNKGPQTKQINTTRSANKNFNQP